MGYPKDLPFVHEGPKLSKRYGKPEFIPKISTNFTVRFESTFVQDFQKESESESSIPWLPCPELQQEQCFAIFMYGLSRGVESILDSPMRPYRRWSEHLLPLFGKHALLDASVRAVTLAYVGNRSKSTTVRNECRPYYDKALRCLSATLTSKAEISCETLSATVLLAFCEIFLGDKHNAWIRHAGGVGALMRVRGPASHRNGFGREIYLAYRNYLIMEAGINRTPCFLSQPAWLELSRQICLDLCCDDADSDVFRFHSTLTEVNSFLPGILHDARNLIARAQILGSSQAAKDDILTRCCNVIKNLKTNMDDFTRCMEHRGYARELNDSGDPIIKQYYTYPNSTIAVAYCNTLSSMINL